MRLVRNCSKLRALNSSKIKNGPGIETFLQNKSNGNFDVHDASEMSIQDTMVRKAIHGKSFYIETYGCQMNSSDSEIVRSILNKSGMLEVDNHESANMILVNTCAIRENAEAKIWDRLKLFRSYKYNLKQKWNNPLQKKFGMGRQLMEKPTVAILGCMAERLKTKLLNPEDKLVDVVVGPDAYRDLPNLLAVVQNDDTENAINVQLSLDETYADVTPVRSDPSKPSAYVSIMRGCNNMCSYCIVPFTRGRERSQQLGAVVDQVRQLVEEDDVREIILLGQNVNSYHDKRSESAAENGRKYVTASGFTNMYQSRNATGYRFVDLLDQVSLVHPEVRIRFTSPHPKDFPDEVLDLIAERHNICNQIHMPAQSGNTNVLSRMRRGYSREAYLNLVTNIRQKLPQVALSSDFITGFCNETQSEHHDTLTLLQQVQFDQAFMFAYSLRDKTHAAHKMQDNVPTTIKQQRLSEIIQVFGDTILQKNQVTEIGRYHIVLVEGHSKRSSPSNPELTGLTDTYKRVNFENTPVPSSITLHPKPISIQKGNYVIVRITQANRHSLKGQPISITTLSEINQIAPSSTTIFHDLHTYFNS